MTQAAEHITVLLHEAVEGLAIKPDGIYVDGTFGRGGHSRLILQQLGPNGRLIAIDRDPQAIAEAAKIQDPRFEIVHGPFSGITRYLTERGDLPQAQGARLLATQNELDGKFNGKLDTLWKWIGSSQVALANLNERLKAEQPDLADVPMNVMQLWYQGIAGSGTATRVVAYEHALNAAVVADMLRPPSYVYGAYGSWSSNPTTFKLQLITVQPKA